MAAAQPPSGIVPAQLGFLAIYSPGLGTTDETVEDQIVYYASASTQTRRARRHRSRGARPTEAVSHEERNERLRQIGLAQGMVEFGRSFSEGRPVDTIETEKARVLVHELEPGWWILASVDLTKLPLPATRAAGSATPPGPAEGAEAAAPQPDGVEYSSREVKPAALLLQDLLRAHATFLLHHDASLGALLARSRRKKFTSMLGRYWDLFLSTWSVLLHGNPARAVLGGIRVAAGGELGFGVGEEDRGSGERAVLEGLVARTEGLVDLVVSRFGGGGADASLGEEEVMAREAARAGEEGPWLGTGKEPGAEDGVVFLGSGALARRSLRDVAHWMEDLYSWGENAYGVVESPASTRRARKAKNGSASATRRAAKDDAKGDPGSRRAAEQPSPAPGSPGAEREGAGLDKYMDYLKLGYGKYWSIGGLGTDPGNATPASQGSSAAAEGGHKEGTVDDAAGGFLIGLTGDLSGEAADGPGEGGRPPDDESGDDPNSRIMLRTVTVELEDVGPGRAPQEITDIPNSAGAEPARDAPTATAEPLDGQDAGRTARLRVVVYVSRPFIFTFLFEPHTDSLAWDGLYRTLHHQLTPLKKSLALHTAYRAERPDVGNIAAQIYDLVWDPKALTIHSTVPDIPDPALGLGAGPAPAWSRVEAINTHTHMLSTFAATRADPSELERTSKTSRGWWVVWRRILEREERPAPPRAPKPDEAEDDGGGGPEGRASSPASEGGEPAAARDAYTVGKEIFLVRKASDHGGHSLRGVSMGAGGGWADGASRLAQGIGVDTKKYIEGLLSLSR